MKAIKERCGREMTHGKSFGGKCGRPAGHNGYCRSEIAYKRQVARSQEYSLAHPEIVRKRNNNWNQRHPERHRKAWSEASWRRYGIVGMTVERYEKMLADQGGVCAVCFGPPRGKNKRLAVDHDHNTGEPRGLLCSKCNKDLAVVEDELFMRRAALYLEGGE